MIFSETTESLKSLITKIYLPKINSVKVEKTFKKAKLKGYPSLNLNICYVNNSI